MKKLLDSDWLRTVQFFLNTVQKRVNWMQKKVIKQAFWLVYEQRSSQIANQIFFFFQINRAPWLAHLWRNFFLTAWSLKSPEVKRALKTEKRVQSPYKVQNILHANFFMFILLISNHTVFIVQFGINLHLWVFQKAKLHSPKRLVQFQLFENSLVQINSKLNSKPYDYLYKLIFVIHYVIC